MIQPLQQGAGRLPLTLILLGMLPLFYLNLTEARGLIQCEPQIEEDCFNFCDKTLYYHSEATNKCELCITCPVGMEPSDINPCRAQARSEEVMCVSCGSGEFSTKEDQDPCVPCTECYSEDRIVAVECSTTGDRRCGACKPGFYEEHESTFCILCKHATQQRDIDTCKDSTTTTAMLTTTQALSITDETSTSNIAGMKKLAEGTILTIVISTIVGIIVVFGIIVCGYVAYFKIQKKYDDSSKSSKLPTVSYSPADRIINGGNSITSVIDFEENQINVAKVEKMMVQGTDEAVNVALPEASSTSATASAVSETKSEEQRSMSVSGICITPNPLAEMYEDVNVTDVAFKPTLPEWSSGDESDQGLTTCPEDAILPQKRKLKLMVPTKKPTIMRRKSDTSVLPLRSDGGSFSSWSVKEGCPSKNMSSKKSWSISSSVHSLSSQPRPFRRRLSLDSAARLETKPLCAESRMGSQKGPFAQPEQQQNEHYPPTVCQDSYPPVYPICGEKCNEAGHIDDIPTQLQEPIAKYLYTAAQTGDASPRQVLPETSSNYSSNKPPGNQNQKSQHSVSKTQHSPPGTVLNIYHGPVITGNNCSHLTVDIGDHNNQLQQGGGCTKTDKPRTPVAIKCSEEPDPFKL